MKGKIFNAQEVQAIIAGNKTQFREVIKPQPWHVVRDADFKKGNNIPKQGHEEKEIKCPYQVGQKIFCKESFSSYYEDDAFVRGDIFLYRADEDSKDLEDVHWKPAQHMKQEHSRLTLQIKEIRVERLADISEEDVKAEGITGFCNEDASAGCGEGWQDPHLYKRKWQFKFWWNSTHKKPEEKFEANPFVWCVSF
jgi:hypothetical protein